MIMIIISTALPGYSETNYILLKAATIAETGSPEAIGLAVFKELVEQRTDGYIKINIYTDGVLGNDEQLIKGLQKGTVDLAACAAFKYADYVEEFEVLELPFLFYSVDHWKAMINGVVGRSLAERAKDNRGDIVLGYITSGPVNIFSNKEIPFLTRVRGLYFRTMTVPSHREAWATIGMEPVALAYSEVKIGLQARMIDAAETNFINFQRMKFYESSKNILRTEHYIPTIPLLLSKMAWYKIPQSYQSILLDCAREASDYEVDYCLAKNKEIEREMVEKYWIKITDFEEAEKETISSRLGNYHKTIFTEFGLEKVWEEIKKSAAEYKKLLDENIEE